MVSCYLLVLLFASQQCAGLAGWLAGLAPGCLAGLSRLALSVDQILPMIPEKARTDDLHQIRQNVTYAKMRMKTTSSLAGCLAGSLSLSPSLSRWLDGWLSLSLDG